MDWKGPVPSMWKILFLIGLSLTAVAAAKEEESEFVELTLLDQDLSTLDESFYREHDPAIGMEDNAKKVV